MAITPEQVRKLRTRTGLNQTEAAKCLHVTMRSWQNWETTKDRVNHRQMPEGYVELFCLKNNISYPPF